MAEIDRPKPGAQPPPINWFKVGVIVFLFICFSAGTAGINFAATLLGVMLAILVVGGLASWMWTWLHKP